MLIHDAAHWATPVRWQKHTGAHRPCGACLVALHQGDATGPPQPARTKRTSGPAPTYRTALYLCSSHTQEWKSEQQKRRKAKR